MIHSQLYPSVIFFKFYPALSGFQISRFPSMVIVQGAPSYPVYLDLLYMYSEIRNIASHFVVALGSRVSRTQTVLIVRGYGSPIFLPFFSLCDFVFLFQSYRSWLHLDSGTRASRVCPPISSLPVNRARA